MEFNCTKCNLVRFAKECEGCLGILRCRLREPKWKRCLKRKIKFSKIEIKKDNPQNESKCLKGHKMKWLRKCVDCYAKREELGLPSIRNKNDWLVEFKKKVKESLNEINI